MRFEWEVICNDELLGDGIVTARAKVHGGWLVMNEYSRVNEEEYFDIRGTSSLVFIPDVHHCWEIDYD